MPARIRGLVNSPRCAEGIAISSPLVVCGASHSAVCLYLNTPRVGLLLKQVVLVDLGRLTNCQNLPSVPGSLQMEPLSMFLAKMR